MATDGTSPSVTLEVQEPRRLSSRPSAIDMAYQSGDIRAQPGVRRPSMLHMQPEPPIIRPKDSAEQARYHRNLAEMTPAVRDHGHPNTYEKSQHSHHDANGGKKHWDARLFFDWDRHAVMTFMEAWFCPCVTFGEIMYRRKHPEDRALHNYNLCNGPCWSWYAMEFFFCGGTVWSGINRTELRDELNIKGNGCTDCLAHCCCLPFALIQEQRQLEFNESDNRRHREIKEAQRVYEAREQMVYRSMN